MITHGGFYYCQARIQARFAALPGNADWQRLSGARTFPAFIEEARIGPLKPWVKGFSSLSGAHDLERGLRNLAWELVDEIAGWAPAPWTGAILWTGWVPLLPVFEHCARGDPPPQWASLDPRLRLLLADDGTLCPAALDRAGLSALISPGEPARVVSNWTKAWRDHWPATGRESRRQLDSLCTELDAHLSAFRSASVESAWGLRHGLREHLRLRFHQYLMQPATVFIYLALVLLDLERLRADLLSRNIFGRMPPMRGNS